MYVKRCVIFKTRLFRVRMYIKSGIHVFLRAKSNVQKLMYLKLGRFKGCVLNQIQQIVSVGLQNCECTGEKRKNQTV